ncbi:MAG: Single-stranded DNA binding protein [Methanosarcinaceae archaeon]|nr:Single-stranded DNA binding protein [Methanosarcinaceae archaeon]
MDYKLAPHIEELTKALGNTNERVIQEELETLLKFRVPMDEAKRTVLRKFKSNVFPVKQIKDLSSGAKTFEIAGRIIEIEEKAINLRGNASTIFSGTLADETGTCSFTAWFDFSLKRGDAICIKNSSTRSWHNRPELNFGERSEVLKLPDDAFPNVEELTRTSPKKLHDIGYSDMSISAVAMVVKLYHKNVKIRERNMKIIEGVIGDDTAKLPFTSWVPLPDVDIGSVVRFDGASVRMFRGLPSININENTSVTIVNPSLEEIPFTFESISQKPEPLPIGQILLKDGLFDVAAIGNIISVRPGSGIIQRCPVCNRVIQKNTCRVHGPTESFQDMRIKTILDDGTGAVSVMLNRELSEIVYGKSMFEAEEMIRTEMSRDEIFEDMKRVLTGRYLGVRGNTSRTEFGVTLVAESVWSPDDDITLRVSNLLELLEPVGENING